MGEIPLKSSSVSSFVEEKIINAELGAISAGIVRVSEDISTKTGAEMAVIFESLEIGVVAPGPVNVDIPDNMYVLVARLADIPWNADPPIKLDILPLNDDIVQGLI